MYIVALSVTCEQSGICLCEAMSEKATLTHTSIPVVSSMIVNWGTDVEILTLAHMLKTPVYTYHEDTKSWNRYSLNAVERSLDESNISERGMYIRLARSHFDVVSSSVRNQ